MKWLFNARDFQRSMQGALPEFVFIIQRHRGCCLSKCINMTLRRIWVVCYQKPHHWILFNILVQLEKLKFWLIYIILIKFVFPMMHNRPIGLEDEPFINNLHHVNGEVSLFQLIFLVERLKYVSNMLVNF